MISTTGGEGGESMFCIVLQFSQFILESNNSKLLYSVSILGLSLVDKIPSLINNKCNLQPNNIMLKCTIVDSLKEL